MISNPTLHILDKEKGINIEDETFLAPTAGLQVNTYSQEMSTGRHVIFHREASWFKAISKMTVWPPQKLLQQSLMLYVTHMGPIAVERQELNWHLSSSSLPCDLECWKFPMFVCN